jgi:DNA-binding CsgD family transcriptional regulator
MSDVLSQPRQTGESRAIYGRDVERAHLHELLDGATGGRGSLALISGAAGIGKTTLVDDLVQQARWLGCSVLIGACYDLTTNLPYGPWRELIGDGHRAGMAAGPAHPSDLAWLSAATSADAMVAGLRDYLEALVGYGPLLLVLEDLHWADAESLEFLRIFGRRISSLPLLLIGTYRDDEVTLGHPLYRLLPHLVRESDAQRIKIAPLDQHAIRDIVEHRYDLSSQDQDRLTGYLDKRSGGVPFYLLELLRTLEEQQHLRRTQDGWTLGDLDLHQVPVLIRQLIEGRLAGMDADSRRLLEVASVIGLDVPIMLWKQVAAPHNATFGGAVEQALSANVLAESAPGTHLHFTHALVRDSLYEGIPLLRRQDWHRRVAEALEESDASELEAIAYHYRRALDPRAAECFIRAGVRAEPVAWLTAEKHFEAALEVLGPGGADPNRRGWLHLRRAKLLRGAQPRTALTILATVTALARDTEDALLLTYATFFRGQIRCLAGEIQAGIDDLEAAVRGLATLMPDDLQRAGELERQGFVVNEAEVEGQLAGLLAAVGRIEEALGRSEAIIARTDSLPTRAWWARGIALGLAGRAAKADAAFRTCRELLPQAVEEASIALVVLYQATLVQLPYHADNLAERRRFASESEAAWQRAGSTYGDVSPRLAVLPFLLVEGHWEEARELALAGIQLSDITSEKHLTSAVVLTRLARAQGDTALAWKMIHDALPGGPHTLPGHSDFDVSMAFAREAISLCLDADDLSAARAWLEMHDYWLAWSGAVLGRADGQLLWASYHHVAGNLPRAYQHAEQAFALASDPRQPLALLAAHRLLGELQAHSGQTAAAQEHLEAALALAGACAVPYERALTLLAMADCDRGAGELERAASRLQEAREIFVSLEGRPALAQADTLDERIAEQMTVARRTAPMGLSPREIDVLRLLAAGRHNREIAEALFLSVRTVERHLTNLYTKLGVDGRAQAIAFAHDHNLV